MIHTLAIANYRSLRQLVVPLGRLNVITGADGSGKTKKHAHRGRRRESST
jgi:predicted ATPase